MAGRDLKKEGVEVEEERMGFGAATVAMGSSVDGRSPGHTLLKNENFNKRLVIDEEPSAYI